MPSDANGVYSLPAGYLAETGETIQASQHNPPLEDLAASMSARLMRSGAAPMTGPLKVTDGSVGSPAAQFANAPSTGLYKTTNGIGVSVGGTKVAEFGPGGIISGARFIGELIPFTGRTAPALTVIPVGQTLSRTAFPDLWAFAQAEIATGNNFFYNNGDGSTTFGIGDCRGRALVSQDGGAGRISISTLTAVTIGGAGGSENQTLTLGQLPTGITSAGTFALSQTNILSNPNGGLTLFSANSGSQVWQAWGTGASIINTPTITASGTVTSNNTGGASHSSMQPTMITNYVLFTGA